MRTVVVSEEITRGSLFYGLHSLFERAKFLNLARVGLRDRRFDTKLVLGEFDARGFPNGGLLADICQIVQRVEVHLLVL